MFNASTQLVYEAIGKPQLKPPYTKIVLDLEKRQGVCALCGEAFETGVLRNKLISDRFTDFDVFHVPDSPDLCPACAYALNCVDGYLMKYAFLATPDKLTVFMRDKGEGLKKSFAGVTMQSLMSQDNEAYRQSLSEILWSLPTNKPFVFVIHGLGNPQHHLLRSRVNYSLNNGFYVQYEQDTVWFPPYDELRSLWDAVAECRGAGIFSDYIKGLGEFPAPRTTKPEIQARWGVWVKHAPLLKQHANSPYLELLVDVFVPKKAE
jgi:hypothetical protein